MARREQGRQLLSPKELVILVVSIVGAIAGIVPRSSPVASRIP
jgi:arginine:ornithine antiporter/lysine permease